LRKDYQDFNICTTPASACFAIEDKVNSLWKKWQAAKEGSN